MAFLWMNLKAKLYSKVWGTSPLNEPWRHIEWRGRRKSHLTVSTYQPHSAAQHLRILIHGLPGSGKSSLINSVDSALRGIISTRSLTATYCEHSFTKKYKSYKIEKDGPGSYYPFVFCDTTDIETASGRGAEVDEIKMIMEGRVRDGFQFNSGRPQNDRYYNQTPTINDKVHVLVCVVAADTINIMDNQHFHKIRKIREEASDLGIPQVVVVTKIDKACQVVAHDVKHVYRSSDLKYLMEQVSMMVGIPLNCVFPIKNYNEKIKTNEDMDTLILNTMKMIINFGEDFLNDQD